MTVPSPVFGATSGAFLSGRTPTPGAPAGGRVADVAAVMRHRGDGAKPAA